MGLATTRPRTGDPLGRPLRSPGPAGDVPRALGVWPRLGLADADDDPHALRHRLADIEAKAVIPCHPRRKRLMGYDAAISKHRTRIERSFNTRNPFRRLATRADRQALSFRAFRHLAAAHVWRR